MKIISSPYIFSRIHINAEKNTKKNITSQTVDAVPNFFSLRLNRKLKYAKPSKPHTAKIRYDSSDSTLIDQRFGISRKNVKSTAQIVPTPAVIVARRLCSRLAST